MSESKINFKTAYGIVPKIGMGTAFDQINDYNDALIDIRRKALDALSHWQSGAIESVLQMIVEKNRRDGEPQADTVRRMVIEKCRNGMMIVKVDGELAGLIMPPEWGLTGTVWSGIKYGAELRYHIY